MTEEGAERGGEMGLGLLVKGSGFRICLKCGGFKKHKGLVLQQAFV